MVLSRIATVGDLAWREPVQPMLQSWGVEPSINNSEMAGTYGVARPTLAVNA